MFLSLSVGENLSISTVCDGSRSTLFCLPEEWPFGMINKAVASAALCFLGGGVAAVL